MNKLLTAILAAAFAASPVYAQTTAAPAKDEKKAEAKKDEKKAEEKKASGRGHESPGSRARAIPFCAPSIDAGMIVGYPKG